MNVGDTVNFKIGSGADALSLYAGDNTRNFEKSRLNLVENMGYTEAQLKTNLYAERIPGLKEYRMYVPSVEGVPQGYTLSSGNIETYTGKLVPWDFSNATNSKYLKINLTGGPVTLTMNMNKAIIPGMTTINLATAGAVVTAANNNFTTFMSFPDGFGPTDTNPISVRFAIQIVIDGLPGDILYFDQTVREFLEGRNFGLAATNGVIANWRAKNPTANMANGIDEIRFIFNADDPLKIDDDGDLLDYKGNVYIQEISLGDPANMVKSFDRGVAIPYVLRVLPLLFHIFIQFLVLIPQH